jgi:pilus assembly protein CpaB
MKEKIIPIVSLLIGILAFMLTFNYLKSEQKKLKEIEANIYKNAQKVRVMAAANDIPAGTVIKSKDLGTLFVYKSSVGNQVVIPEDGKMLIGKKTLYRINAKEPIFWSHIDGGLAAAHGLAMIIKPGMRAISLAVSGAEAVSGMIQPNDRIDILGTFPFPSKEIEGEMETVTLTLLQDVSVLAAGQKLANQAATRSNRAGYSSITVEVTPREAELLVFAQQMKGRITLSLRNMGDVSFEQDLPEVNFEHLQNALPDLNLFRQKNIRHKRNIPSSQ